jgi:hypothetical protein
MFAKVYSPFSSTFIMYSLFFIDYINWVHYGIGCLQKVTNMYIFSSEEVLFFPPTIYSDDSVFWKKRIVSANFYFYSAHLQIQLIFGRSARYSRKQNCSGLICHLHLYTLWSKSSAQSFTGSTNYIFYNMEIQFPQVASDWLPTKDFQNQTRDLPLLHGHNIVDRQEEGRLHLHSATDCWDS